MTIAQAMQLAVSHHQAGRLPEADQIYRQVLQQAPEHAPALHLRGVLLGEAPEAIGLIRRAIQIEPGNPQYHHDLGLALMRAGQLPQAVAALEQAVQLRPESADEHNALGVALKQDGRLDEAIAAYRQSIELNPSFAEAYNNLALALRLKGDFEQAITAARRAMHLTPISAVAYNTLGMALAEPARSAQAIAAFTNAIQLSPNYAQAHLNLAMRLLLLGDFQRGWTEYQWRWGVDAPDLFNPNSQSHWDGSDLKGQTILLHSERGLGDTLQFVRYAPMVAGRGGRVVLGVQPELARLLQTAPGVQQVFSRGATLPHFAQHCPLLSLPQVLGTDLNTIPQSVPYLSAEPNRRIIPKSNQLAIGLVWAGNPGHLNDRHRSIRLSAFAPLSQIERADFYSLQMGPAAEQGRPAGLEMVDVTSELHDFADTAAVVQALDLVITADTAMAHLAGAMGKRVWVLLPCVPDWRWLLARDDSPWYPTMRLFRQDKIGDWDAVMSNVVSALQSLEENRH